MARTDMKILSVMAERSISHIALVQLVQSRSIVYIFLYYRRPATRLCSSNSSHGRRWLKFCNLENMLPSRNQLRIRPVVSSIKSGEG